MGKRKAKHDPDSLASRACDYATQVLRRISFVRKAIADNNAQEAARFSVEVDQLSERIQAAIEWEHPALVGVGVAKRARNANDAKSAIRQSRIEKVAKSYNTFRTLNPKWLASMIDEHVRDALKIKEHTFQNYLAEARKQGRIPKRHRRAPR